MSLCVDSMHLYCPAESTSITPLGRALELELDGVATPGHVAGMRHGSTALHAPPPYASPALV